MKWYLKALRQYADFEGRAGRREYWMFTLFNAIFLILIQAVCFGISEAMENPMYMFLSYFYLAAIFLPSLAVTYRRIHDIDRSGWFLLLFIIPIVGPFILLVFLIKPSTPEKNRYGEIPESFNAKAEFNRSKSAAIILITVGTVLIASDIYNFSDSIIQRLNFDYPLNLFQAFLHRLLFPTLINAGILIAGILLMKKEKRLDKVAIVMIITAVFHIAYIVYGITTSEVTQILNYSAIFAPITLLILGTSILQKGKYRNATILLAATTIILVIIQTTYFTPKAELLLNKKFLFLIYYRLSFFWIVKPIAFLLIALYIPKLMEQQSKIIPFEEKAPNKVTPPLQDNNYYERDNRGMRVETIAKSMAYWLGERLHSPKKDPFVYYTFQNEDDAKAAMYELPFLYQAADSGKLIAKEVLRYGYFAVTENGKLTGEFDAFIAGEDFTHQMWEQTHEIFAKHNGKKKNDLEPDKNKKVTSPTDGKAQNVTFLRENRNQGSIWRVYKAQNKADALAFLSQQQITRALYYVVVETPEGNFGRDIDGFYKE